MEATVVGDLSEDRVSAFLVTLADSLLRPERCAIASRNADEGDVLDGRLKRNCHTGNMAFAVGGK